VTLEYGTKKNTPDVATFALEPTTGLEVSVTYRVLELVEIGSGPSPPTTTVIYGAYGDRYVNNASSLVAGVVHVPGGPRESRDLTPPNDQMLLPFPFGEDLETLVTNHATLYQATDGAGLTKLNTLLQDNNLKFKDGFVDPGTLGTGVFLAPTNAALDTLLAEYNDLTGVADLLVDPGPYLTPMRRLLQFHTFRVVGAQELPYLLTVLDIADGGAPRELQANDGWVRTPPP